MISVIIPTIRPEGCKRCIDALRVGTSAAIWGDLEIIREHDAERIGVCKMVNRLVRKAKGEWICYLGDDTIPQYRMLDRAMDHAMSVPCLISINDQYNANGLPPTHWLVHRDLLPMVSNCGQWFSEEYKHVFCDHELGDICREIGRFVFAPDARLIHDHPLVTGAAWDEAYTRAYKIVYDGDYLTYIRRKQERWMRR
jgi:hypothetical protein